MIKRTIYFIIIAMVFASCFCKKLNFDNDETFWTDVYDTGDTLIFQSNDNITKKDTIIILAKKVFTPTGDCNAMVSQYDPEGCVIDYKYKHEGKESDFDYFVQHFKHPDGLSLPVLRVYGTEFSGLEALEDTTIITKRYGKLNDCFTFHSHNSYNGFSEFKLKTFVWNKELGLVMFEGINKEKYELYKKVEK